MPSIPTREETDTAPDGNLSKRRAVETSDLGAMKVDDIPRGKDNIKKRTVATGTQRKTGDEKRSLHD